MNESLNELKVRLRSIAELESVMGILEWDQQVNLPNAAHDFRSGQVSSMTEIVHRENISPSIGKLLIEISSIEGELDEGERVVFRGAKKKYERLTKIPESFAARKAKSQSDAYQKWITAREAGEFDLFAPCLEEQIRFCKEEADFVGMGESPYAYMIDQFDEGMEVSLIEKLFSSLAPSLSEMIPPLVERQKEFAPVELKGFSKEAQKTFLHEVVKKLGFDFERGRIDESVHPFCAGSGHDIRMTTRFFEDHPLDSLYSAIHEAGHAMYEQGLNQEEFGNALGSYAGMAVHESQSRLWENQVSRSQDFWMFWESRYRELFPEAMGGISMDAWMRKLLEVKPIPIRVDADEITYNLHVIIRFELEKALFDGSISVSDLPGEWNSLYQKYLGIRPASDKVGVLQDVHWATGAFGYFPSYSLGNIVSAQLWETILEIYPNITKNIQEGDYQPILSWLHQNVHDHGRKYTTQQLVEVATGQELSEQPLIRYLKEKYFGFFQILS